MRIIATVTLCCALLLGTLFIAVQTLSSDPSTDTIESDILEVEQQLAAADVQIASGSGGALLSIYEVRRAVLSTALTMLETKRLSLLRRIDLQYVADGVSRTPSEEQRAEIARDLTRVTSERDAAQQEADMYTGGLLQMVALMEVATADLTISQLKLADLAEKYGFLLGLPPSVNGDSASPIGQSIVEDEAEAL